MERGPAREAAPAGQQVTTGGTARREPRSGESKDTVRTPAPAAPAGLEFSRYFTLPGVDPFDEVEWEIRSAVIGNEKGKVVFEQRDVEIPKFWSQQATNIDVSKFFLAQMVSHDRELSVKHLSVHDVDSIKLGAI